jgi:hypothetical protein
VNMLVGDRRQVKRFHPVISSNLWGITGMITEIREDDEWVSTGGRYRFGNFKKVKRYFLKFWYPPKRINSGLWLTEDQMELI